MTRRARHIGALLPAGAVVVLAASALADDGRALVGVPSGQKVQFVEMRRDTAGVAGLTYRYRFIAPEIARDGGAVDFETAVADMDHLCQVFALGRLSEGAERPSQIIISLSDRAVEFGSANPDATQFFEAYSVESGACVWEGF